MAQSLKQNPFSVLGAAMTDGMQRLAQRADEAMLFGDDGAEDAFAALTHSMHRLDAEIRWLPGTPDDTVKAIAAYAKSNEPSAYPDLSRLPALAQMNACRELLDAWIIDDRESAVALCRSLSAAWSGIRAQDVMDLLNEGRRIASLPMIADVSDVYERLDGLCAEIVRDIHSRIEAAGVSTCEVMEDAARYYGTTRGKLLEALIHAYALTADGEKKQLEEQIDTHYVQVMKSRDMLACSRTKKELVQAMEQWHRISSPMRRLALAKGKRDAQVRALYDKIYVMASYMNNQFRLHRECAQIMRCCDEVFFDLPEVKEHLRKNLTIAENASR